MGRILCGTFLTDMIGSWTVTVEVVRVSKAFSHYCVFEFEWSPGRSNGSRKGSLFPMHFATHL